MNSAEQVAGEQRVQEHLIAPLQGLGLARPSGMKVDGYTDMLNTIKKKLAYMTALNLQALVVEAMTRIERKGNGRFPMAVDLLVWAAGIQQPSDDGSPLIRAVFAASIGQLAIDEDWAPELLRYVRKVRVWPTPVALREIKQQAAEARRRLEKQGDTLRYGADLTEEEQSFRNNRHAAALKCARIYELARSEKMA